MLAQGLKRLGIVLAIALGGVGCLALATGVALGYGLWDALSRGYLIAGVGCGVVCVFTFGGDEQRTSQNNALGLFVLLTLAFLVLGAALEALQPSPPDLPDVETARAS